jgi:hypothetical protein
LRKRTATLLGQFHFSFASFTGLDADLPQINWTADRQIPTFRTNILSASSGLKWKWIVHIASIHCINIQRYSK